MSDSAEKMELEEVLTSGPDEEEMKRQQRRRHSGSKFHASQAKTDDGSNYYTRKEPHTGRAQRAKLNKSDIGSPTCFKHVTHVGFNAVPRFDDSSEMDLKRLFNMAGVKEEHLQDREAANRIFSVLEKAGSMEAVRKQTRRMTSVEKPSTRTRLRSLSSSSLTPSKRQHGLEQDSPHVAKIAAILARGSHLYHPPSVSKVPPLTQPLPTCHFPSMRPPPPMPPYLNELSQSFSPAADLPAGHRSKKEYLPLNLLSTKSSMKPPPTLLLVAKAVTSETDSLPLPPSIPDHSCPDSKINMVSSPPSLPHSDSSSNITKCVPAHYPSSIPSIEPTIKLGDVPSPPPFPQADNSGTITSCYFNECLTKCAAIPLPPSPPPLNFNKQSEDLPSNRSECSLIPHNTVASTKEPEHQTNPAMFLDQIKQGIQLKSVTQTVKVENTECSHIVTALMDVMKKRHKALHSSDEEEVEDDNWED
ncbi:actin nucleation-promoting factor WASL-like isoform X2 [Hyla sarda]|uniref:actin nucleation-promoting factor WASL-like isoform X2 n=1 Tax=Hyla sarda TaxID=327740 RepID=UPI0024C29639|nr:actin nucleation-promoting factor WASL-like isoform X2 [Hyla sarda]